jgi:short subunit dehydrogenase-like uncharacterized protein
VSGRHIDVVVLGATGVTGRRVASYLAERAPAAGLSWAAAARDATKLARVLSEEGVADAPTLVADVADAGSLATLAQRSRVVLDLVGPYTLYGRPVIEACVAAGSHYVDLTGEIPFVRTIVDEFDASATAAGAKIVQVCGFEALPPDLSVRLAADAAKERFGEELASADVEAWVAGPPGLPRASDMISGGTLQSLLAVAGADGAGTISDPAALVGERTAAEAIRARSPIGLAPRHGHTGDVVAPMAPAPFINPAVIHRSGVLAGAPPLRYREGIALGGHTATLPLRWGAAGALTATQVALRGVAHASPGARRRVSEALSRALPGSGFGPAADRLAAWRWGMRTYARTTGGHELEVTVDGEAHPGYLATARMVGEAGVLLATEGATPARFGCLTPSIALGTASAPSFEHAGVRFSVLS